MITSTSSGKDIMNANKIYSSIFKNDIRGQALATTYARSGQDDIGIDWIERQSVGVATYMAYLRVHQSAEDACLFLNGLIADMLTTLNGHGGFVDEDEDFVTCDTIQALRYLILSDESAETHIMENIIDEVCSQNPLCTDCDYLYSIEKIKP